MICLHQTQFSTIRPSFRYCAKSAHTKLILEAGIDALDCAALTKPHDFVRRNAWMRTVCTIVRD